MQLVREEVLDRGGLGIQEGDPEEDPGVLLVEVSAGGGDGGELMDNSKLNKVINELNNLPTTVYCGFYQLRMTHNLRDETIKLLKEQDEQKKQILKAVWDVLHEGVSTDTVADQDWVYEQIRNRVDKMY